MKNKAFTVIEFVLTLIIMMIICVATPMLTLKKTVRGSKTAHTKDLYICVDKNTSLTGEDATIAKNANDKNRCIFTVRDIGAEFYSIQLVGGGAGAASGKKGGGAGEVVQTYLPAMLQKDSPFLTTSNERRFCIELGTGGTNESINPPYYETLNQNGKPTILYEYKNADCDYDVNEKNPQNEKYLNIIAFAEGGKASNEIINTSVVDDDKGREVSSKLNDSFNSNAGKGGNSGSSGRTGMVIIRW